MENLYDNGTALKELIKMMRRKDLVTVAFVVDRFGYEAIEVESKIMDKFLVQFTPWKNRGGVTPEAEAA